MTTLKNQRGSARAARAGFTLIELLVVIGIIAILVSLIAGGIFRFFNAQRQSNTEGTITKLGTTLRAQWDAVLNQHKNDDIPSGIVAMAGGDMRLARVIWLKYQLKLNFPTSYGEATNPFPATDGGGNPNPFHPANLAGSNVPLKSPYATEMKTLGFNNATSSSAFLLLAVNRKRSGTVLNVDDMGAGAVADNGSGLRQFIDGWGNPLVFTRWVTLPSPPWGPSPIVPNSPPTPSTIQIELDGNFPGKAAALYRDPLDPQGLLLNKIWNSQTNNQNMAGVYWFEQIFHSVHTTPNGVWTPTSSYLVPVISSAGPNGIPGDDDDLWSFRLRAGAKGDQ